VRDRTSRLKVSGFSKMGIQSKNKMPGFGKSESANIYTYLVPGYCADTPLKVATLWSNSASFEVVIDSVVDETIPDGWLDSGPGNTLTLYA
jgi:hypothetical protein